jgi:hypothetical protein
MTTDADALVATLRRHGPLSARQVLAHAPALQDTARATQKLHELVEQGRLVSNHEPGRNVSYAVPAARKKVPATSQATKSAPAPVPAPGPGRNLAQARRDAIVAILQRARAPLRRELIEAKLPDKHQLERRSFNRVLQELQASGLIVRHGNTRAARYELASKVPASTPAASAPATMKRARTSHRAETNQAMVLAFSLMELVQAERRLYAQLVRASAASSDPTVRCLANAVPHQQEATNALRFWQLPGATT